MRSDTTDKCVFSQMYKFLTGKNAPPCGTAKPWEACDNCQRIAPFPFGVEWVREVPAKDIPNLGPVQSFPLPNGNRLAVFISPVEANNSLWGMAPYTHSEQYIYTNTHGQKAVFFHCCTACKRMELKPYARFDSSQFCSATTRKLNNEKKQSLLPENSTSHIGAPEPSQFVFNENTFPFYIKLPADVLSKKDEKGQVTYYTEADIVCLLDDIELPFKIENNILIVKLDTRFQQLYRPQESDFFTYDLRVHTKDNAIPIANLNLAANNADQPISADVKDSKTDKKSEKIYHHPFAFFMQAPELCSSSVLISQSDPRQESKRFYLPHYMKLPLTTQYYKALALLLREYVSGNFLDGTIEQRADKKLKRIVLLKNLKIEEMAANRRYLADVLREVAEFYLQNYKSDPNFNNGVLQLLDFLHSLGPEGEISFQSILKQSPFVPELKPLSFLFVRQYEKEINIIVTVLPNGEIHEELESKVHLPNKPILAVDFDKPFSAKIKKEQISSNPVNENKNEASSLELKQHLQQLLKAKNPLIELLALFESYYLPKTSVKFDEAASRHLDFIFDFIKNLIKQNPVCLNAADGHGRTAIFYLLDFPSRLNKFSLTLADYFIDQGASVNISDYKGQRFDFYALTKKNYEFIDLIYKKNKERNLFLPVDIQDQEEKTLLHNVASRFHPAQLQTMQTLLEGKADPNIFPTNGVPLLCINYNQAVRKQILNLLAQYGADPDQQNENGYTFFHMAAFNGESDYLQLFKSKNINAQNKKGQTALMVTLNFCPSKEMVEAWIKLGADPNIADLRGNTPLMKAVEFGQSSICQYLLEQKASIDSMNSKNESIVDCVLRSKDPQIMQWVVEKFPREKLIKIFQSERGILLLLNFIIKSKEPEKNKLQAILNLLQADIHLARHCSLTPNLIEKILSLGYCNNELVNKIMKKLFAQGLLVNAKNDKGETVLNLLSQNELTGRFEAFQCLLKNNANPNLADDAGNTPLMYAASHYSDLRVVVLLQKHGADINVVNRKQESALSNAIQASRLVTASYLIEQKASVDPVPMVPAAFAAAPIYRETLLHNCVKLFTTERYLEVLKKLLTLMPRWVNTPNQNGNTPLMELITAECKENEFKLFQSGLELLLKCKADPNLPDNQGHNTIAVIAKKSSKPSMAIVKLLRKHGADLHLPNGFNQRPLKHALVSNHMELVTYILNQSETQEYLNHIDNEGKHLLHYACQNLSPAALCEVFSKWDVIKGFNANILDATNFTPLRYVMWRAVKSVTNEAFKLTTGKNPGVVFKDAILWLLQHKADPNDTHDTHIVDFVVNIDDPKLVKIFREHKAEHPDALILAAKRDAFNSIPLIAEMMKSTNHWQVSLDTCLSIMIDKLAFCGNSQLTLAMIDKYYNLNRYDRNTMLTVFRNPGEKLKQHYIDAIEFFIKQGANVEHVENGVTLLMRLMQHHNYEVVFKLAEKVLARSKDKAVYLNQVDTEGRNALLYLMQSVQAHYSIDDNLKKMLDIDFILKLIELFVINKTDVNHVTSTGQTALMQAVQWTKCVPAASIVMQKLLECKADINIKDKANNTALTIAAQSCQSLLPFLWEHKADIRQIDNKVRNNFFQGIKAVAEGHSQYHFNDTAINSAIRLLMTVDVDSSDSKEQENKSSLENIRNLPTAFRYNSIFKQHRMSFLSGMHEKSSSPLKQALRKNVYYDPNVVGLIFELTGWLQPKRDEDNNNSSNLSP